MIEAVKLSKAYYQGKARIGAVRNVNLTISRGETVLIAGPSGAGKSTLLHLLGGLDRPTEGGIFFDGVDFYRLGDKPRSYLRNEKIGFVFQFYYLLPEFTVSENVMLPAIMRRRGRKSLPGIIKRVEGLLKLVGLEKRANHKPAELSGGESQRVAIARALVNSPEALLCDEPTGNLDSKMGQEIMDCLWVLKEERNMALVIITHDERIHEGFDKRYTMKDGILKEIPNDKTEGLPEREICREG